MAAKATINELFGSDSDEEEEQVNTEVRTTSMIKFISVLSTRADGIFDDRS
jgi:hypothetical protein